MALHEILASRSGDVLSHWKARVQGTLAPESMPPMELVDHLPQFLQEIIAALRVDAGSATGPSPEASTVAAGHGEHRLRLGFSLDSVVREYGALHDAIIATAGDAGAQTTLRELRVLFDCTVDGIAQAVSEYARQRDAELARQANEHFAFVAHELRDPLSSAMISYELLKSSGGLPADGHMVGALERGLRRLRDLIDQTLQVARIASGIELRRQWTTLRTLAEDAELSALAEAESKAIEIRRVIEQDQQVHLDVRLVRSALGNLLRNAVKYTPRGSIVELRGRVDGGRAVIEVEDRCGGLPPGKVEQAFAPFVRLDERQGGFGLGLAIAKQAVDAHGGSLRVQNLPGQGCMFVLELPVATES